jgi:nitric oxide reductase subunit C
MLRTAALLLLVLAFLGVSVIAYSDHPRRAEEPALDRLERAGLAVWRRNNCQACHQVHGFGGFHGPDLTNRVTGQTSVAEIGWIVTHGKGRMPAFELSGEELEAVVAWLRWLNDSGRSRPPPLEPRREVVPAHHFRELLAFWSERTGREPPDEVRAGERVWTAMGCGACHRPFALGELREPDLSASAADGAFERLSAILDQGSGRMPATELDLDAKRNLHAFLRWIAERRAELVELDLELIELEPFAVSAVPWFEYK